MVITYYGATCVRLQSGDTSLMTDPINNRLKADVVLRTEQAEEHAGFLELQEEISHAGEYEIKGIEILGIQEPSQEKKQAHTVYAADWEEIRCAFFGFLKTAPGIQTLDAVGKVDVLFLGVGEGYLPEKEAVLLVKKLAPSIVVPLFKKNATEFLKAMDQRQKPVEKFVFKKKELVPEAQTVVLLEAK